MTDADAASFEVGQEADGPGGPTADLTDPEYWSRARAVMPGGFGRSTFGLIGSVSPVAASGEGCYLTDTKGHRLIDCNNNFTSLIHGHAHPQVTEAAVKAIRDGACFGIPNMNELLHAEHLCERIPYADSVRYANSGTEAVMLAIRVARAATGRDKVVFVNRAYHGTAEPALIPGGEKARRGVPEGVSKDIILLALNDFDGLDRVFAEHGEEIALVMLDPVPNRAGLFSVQRDFAHRAQSLCRGAGALLAFDEVIAFRMSWASTAAAWEITPDLVVLGKVIGGGLPIGAIAGRADVMAELDPRSGALEHGGTFSGNPVAMAAGRTALELYTPAEVERLNRLGEMLREQLRSRTGEAGWEIRGEASLARPFPSDKEIDHHDVQRDLWWEAYKRGLLLTQNCLFALSTPMDEELVGEVTDKATEAMDVVAGRWFR